MICPAGLHCLKCGAPLSLTKAGSVRKGKKYCSLDCQQGAIKEARTKARAALKELLKGLELDRPELTELIRKELHTLGML